MKESAIAIWQEPINPEVLQSCQGEVYNVYHKLRTKIAEIAQRENFSKSEVARRADVAVGTLSSWFSGTYNGRYDKINERLQNWLHAFEEAADVSKGLPAGPEFIQTRTSRELIETFSYAQMLPEMAVVTLAAGMGKTRTAREFCASRPHAHLVTMSPVTKTVFGMMAEIADSLGVLTSTGMPATAIHVHRVVAHRLGRTPNTLLIIDEAQNLIDEAVDQARSLLDQYKCGLVLMGNEEIYTRFDRKSNGPSYAQIKRRIGKKMHRRTPYAEDIQSFIDAWGVEDAGARKLLTGIGKKPGALGQIDKTMRLASIIARGDGDEIAEKHVRAAWENRGMEF